VVIFVAVDENVKRIILSYLAKWKTTRVSKDRLLELRDEIIKRTGFKSLPLTMLKKWVRKTVKETAQAEKLKAIQYGGMPIAAPVSEKAFLQSISFDLASMRRSLDRIANRLVEIEKELSSREGRK